MNEPSKRARDVMWTGLVALVVIGVVAAITLIPGHGGPAPTQSANQPVVIVGSAGDPGVQSVPSAAGQPDTRPNVVLITTDDQTLSDLSTMARTKKLIGAAGTTFGHMLSPHPLCCPARAEILTGEFAQSNGVHSNTGPFGGFPNLKDPNNTVGAWLHDSGYRTAVVGKFLNGWSPKLGIPDGWDHWQTSVKSEFGYYGYRMDVNGTNVTYPVNGPYSTDVVSDVTSKLINAWAPAGKPFFIWSSYYAPHGLCGEQEGCRHPPVPAHKFAHYPVPQVAPMLRDPAFDEQDVSDKPALIQRSDFVSPSFAQEDFKQRIRALQSVDVAVQHTLDTLRQNHVLGNTYIMFTSDNGYLIGEHRYIGKILPYEQSLRVPLLVRGPGIKPHTTNDTTVTTVDLASTIADIADVTPGRTQDGLSLLPMLHGGKPLARDSMLIQAGGLGNGAHVLPWLYRGVHTKDYMFATWFQKGTTFLELYDLRKDPSELVNVAADPRYLAITAAMEARLVALQSCTGTGCNRTFGPLPPPKA